MGWLFCFFLFPSFFFSSYHSFFRFSLFVYPSANEFTKQKPNWKIRLCRSKVDHVRLGIFPFMSIQQLRRVLTMPALRFTYFVLVIVIKFSTCRGNWAPLSFGKFFSFIPSSQKLLIYYNLLKNKIHQLFVHLLAFICIIGEWFHQLNIFAMKIKIIGHSSSSNFHKLKSTLRKIRLCIRISI